MIRFGRLTLAILVCNVGFSHGDNIEKKKVSETDSMERELVAFDDTLDLSELSLEELTSAYITNTGALSDTIVCVNEEDGLSQPRALPFYAGRSDGFDTTADCSVKCQSYGYLISGRSDNGFCWCADELGYKESASSNTILYDTYEINKSCDCTNVDTADIGNNLVCVSVINVQADYEGCFKDDVPRSLPIYAGNGMSYFRCALECYQRHYHYFGRQYKKECWCGNGSTYDEYGVTDGCNCDGNNIGFYKQCVYKIPDGKFMPNLIYIGCYNDDNDDRALPNRQVEGDGSIEKCSDVCTEKFFDLFAVQYEMECWCGKTSEVDPYRHGASDECDCDSVSYIGYSVFCLFAVAKPEPTADPTTFTPSIALLPSVSPTIKKWVVPTPK